MASVLRTSGAVPKKKIHPHKFALWVAMASIAMMFAGLTSGYLVRQSQGDWRMYTLPGVFWVSTALIVASSISFILALRAFKARRIPQYRLLVATTLLLGIAFGVCQYAGFYELYHQSQAVNMLNPDGSISQNITVLADGTQVAEAKPVKVEGNPSESFLFIIAGLHLLHIIGGIVALTIVFFRSYRARVKTYSSTGLEVVGQYWHFVDLLWIYLFVFLLLNP